MYLPKELIDLIFTFNPEHRPLYRKCMEELQEHFFILNLVKKLIDELEIELIIEYILDD